MFIPIDTFPFALLCLASFLGSFITVAFGIGGGALLLALMASLLPPIALIPIHGVVQLGSNATRALLFYSKAYWPPVGWFALGSLIGAVFGGRIVVSLPDGWILIGVGAFILWNIVWHPPQWLSKAPFATGVFSSFLTMFFGATGSFVVNFSRSLKLPKERYVATHAVLMTLQHSLKILVFVALGFAFQDWAVLIIGMILTGVFGTYIGKRVLYKVSEKTFKITLDVMLFLIAMRLIYQGISSL